MIDNNISVLLLKRNNPKEQKKFYDTFCSSMFATALRISGNKSDAEDILQESFLKAFKSINSFEGRGPLEAWLRKIVIHTSINFINAKKITYDIDSVNQYQFGAHATPRLLKLEQSDLNYYLSFLSKLTRLVFTLYHIDGYSLNEIAKKININESACRCRYMRAKRKLCKVIMASELSVNENIKLSF